MTDIAALGIEIRTGDATRARKELDLLTASGAQAERQAASLERASSRLNGVLAAGAASLVVAQLVRYSDAYQQVNARLRLVTGSQEAFNRVQGDLNGIADETRNSLTSTIDLYSRIARSTKTLAASDSDRLQVTKAISQALIVSGASGASAEAALIQLGQGFASGTLRGEELNSVLEQTPRLAQAIADGLGVPLGKLRELGQAGKLTGDAVFKALQSQAGVLQAEFNKIPTTISQAFQVAENRLTRFVGQQAEASGASRALIQVIDGLSKNIDTLTAVALGFGAAKLAQTLLGVAVTARANIATSAQHTAALVAERAAALASAQAVAADAAANLAAAQAEKAVVAAKLSSLQATDAAIVATRAETVAKLQSTQTTIVQVQAQINAARSAGALSFALAALRDGENALAAAQARRAALTTELAVLGQQQARVQAAQTAATAAQTAASGNLLAATSAQTAAQAALGGAVTRTGAIAAGAGRLLGLLGGPIGAITTLLGLGATAWVLWGNSAEEAGDKATLATRKARDELQKNLETIARLNAIIARERSAGTPQGTDRANRLQNQADAAQGRVNAARAEIDRQAAERERNDAIARNENARRLDPLQTANNQRAALTKFLEDNATKSERFRSELGKLKRDLGDLFTPEIEARLKQSIFGDGDAAQGSPLKTEFQNQREKLALLSQQVQMQREATELDKVAADIAAGKFGRITAGQRDLLLANAREIDQKGEQIKLFGEEAKAREAVAQLVERAMRDAAAETRQLIQSNQALREEIEEIGAVAYTKTLLEKARIRSVRVMKQEQLAMRENAGETDAQTEALRQQIELLQQRETLLDERQQATTTNELQQEAQRAGDGYRTTLGDSIEEGILDGFRRGKDLSDIFLDELKAQFARTVLRPVIAPVAEAGNALIGALVNAVAGAFAPSVVAGSDPSGFNGTQNNPSAFVAGGRAYGGGTSPGSRYRVREQGPEVYTEDGKDYLLTGDRGGYVRPMAPAGSGQTQVVNNIKIVGAPPNTRVEERQNSSGGTDFTVLLDQMEKRMADRVSSGNGPLAGSIQSRYGANPAAGVTRR